MGVFFNDPSVREYDHQSKHKEETPFTPGFFRFLLAFSVIIALSFAVLFYLGITTS